MSERQRPLTPRPTKEYRRGIISVPRVPYDEPLTPGLRRVDKPEAIGFIVARDDDE